MLVQSAAANGVLTGPADETVARDFSPTSKKSPKINVLIVDDEPLVRWSLSETLMDNGFAVLQAGDARGAVAALQDAQRPVDVIMLDYRLPDSNSLQLLARIRAMSPRSQVVMMTAYGTPELAVEALRLGAFCFVNKPLEMHEVSDLVSRAYGSTSV
jgi:DNA-binding NtrC family response regulator